MLHDLLHVNLTTFNVRRVPVTEGLQEQKKLSLDTSNAWWLDVLYRGYVFRSKLGLEDYFSQWHEEVATELLYASYTGFRRKTAGAAPARPRAFGRFMVSLGNEPRRPRNLIVGEHITDVTNDSVALPYRQSGSSSRSRQLHLGTLDQAGQRFTEPRVVSRVAPSRRTRTRQPDPIHRGQGYLFLGQGSAQS